MKLRKEITDEKVVTDRTEVCQEKTIPSGNYFQEEREDRIEKAQKKCYIKIYRLPEEKSTQHYGKSTVRADQISKGSPIGKSENYFGK